MDASWVLFDIILGKQWKGIKKNKPSLNAMLFVLLCAEIFVLLVLSRVT